MLRKVWNGLLLAVVGVLPGAEASAQYTSAEQFMTWSVLNVNVKLHDRWRVVYDMSYRSYNGTEADVNNTYRAVVERKAGNWQLGIGYAYFVAHPYGRFPGARTTEEHRIFEQATFSTNNKSVRWQHRFRFEHRDQERLFTASDGSAASERYWTFRPRYRTMLSWAIPRDGKSSRFTLHVFQELFLRFGPSNIVKSRFDQQRLSAQVACRIAKPAEVQVGYMFQDLLRTNGIQEERNHWLMLALIVDLDLSRKAQEPTGD